MEQIMIGNQFIFIHIPRTGGSSLERILLSLETVHSWQALNSKGIVDQYVGPAKHYKASRVQDLAGHVQWQQALKLSIVRNPFDKVISHYFQPYYREINALSDKSLDFFLDAYQPAPHEDGVTCCDYLDRDVDLIIRYENYEEELLALLAPLGIQLHQIRERIGPVRSSGDYRKFYSSHTRQKVEDRYRDDLVRFHYAF